MGANEKHAATYHGGEVTPRTDVVRYYYIDASSNVEKYTGTVSPEGLRRSAEFDRWLETVRAEAKAEALNDVANAFQYKAWSELIKGSLQDRLRVAQPITAWLRARANQYKEETNSGR